MANTYRTSGQEASDDAAAGATSDAVKTSGDAQRAARRVDASQMKPKPVADEETNEAKMSPLQKAQYLAKKAKSPQAQAFSNLQSQLKQAKQAE